MTPWPARTSLALVAATLGMGFARWTGSPLHIHVCGPNSALNMRWIVYGSRSNDNWSAKLCGCEVPDAFADGTRLRFVDNLGALQMERELNRNKEFRKRSAQFKFGKTTK